MPEGHTIHRLARDHTKWFVGQKLATLSPQGRFAAGAAELHGKLLRQVEAYGKHLAYQFAGNRWLHIHLGLYGKFRHHPVPPPEPRGQVRLRAIGRQRAFDLNGPNRCELIDTAAWAAIRNRLGDDPLRSDADPQRAWNRIRKSRAAIGTLLMDQSVVAGVGNIYRSEVLHLAGIHPETPGKNLTEAQWQEVWERLCSLMSIGVRYNRIIISDPAEVGKPRSRMRRDERLLIYKRAQCRTCHSSVESWTMASRRVFACARCQIRS